MECKIEDYFKPGANYMVKDIRPEHLNELMQLVWAASFDMDEDDPCDHDVTHRGGSDTGEAVKEKMVKNRGKLSVVKLKKFFLKLLTTGDDTELHAEIDGNDINAEDLLSSSAAALRDFREANPNAPSLSCENGTPEVVKVIDAVIRSKNLVPN